MNIQLIAYARHTTAGVGKRGASAIDRLVANGRVANAEVWCVDSDRRALDACAASHTLLLSDQQSSDEVRLKPTAATGLHL